MGGVWLLQSLFERVARSLGARALSFFLIKTTGCAGGLSLAIFLVVRVLLTIFIADEATPFVRNMAPSGAQGDGCNEVTSSSSSGNWRKFMKYLISCEKEGDCDPEPSTSTARAPDQGQQPGGEALFQPTGTPPVGGPSQQQETHAPLEVPPSREDVSATLKNFIQRVSKRKPRSDFLLEVEDALHLREASPEKRLKIQEEIEKLLPHCGGDIRTGAKAKTELLRTIRAWENDRNMPGE